MKRMAFLLVVIATLGVVALTVPAHLYSTQEAAPAFVTEIPTGYRDWKRISVSHEEGSLNSFAAVLGNEIGSSRRSGLGAARQNLVPKLSLSSPARRYGVVAA
jgi:hypothetical protein